ncbi:MAG: type II secretion system minor pseudopilin GspK [Verrucomicrobiia bacterium]
MKWQNDSIPCSRQQGGVALVVVLWVIMVLSLMISGFAFTMHVETQVASYSRKELKAEMLARSGVEVAQMELLLNKRKAADAGIDTTQQEWVTNDTWYVDHALGDGIYNVKVIDEESKMPINRATSEQLHRLLSLLNVDPAESDIIVDSILDWTETGDLHRLNGAKTDDYYKNLDPPYRCKNAPLDRVEELLLVRGVTPELFYGAPAKDEVPARPGLADLVTVTSDGQINVNTAPAPVLQAALELDDAELEVILARRGGPDRLLGAEDDLPFRSVDEFMQLLTAMPSELQERISSRITVTSSFFTIKSTGEVSGAKYTIVATVQREGTDVTTVAWREKRGGL